MKVFLLNDVKGVGRKNEIKEVSDGYAFNNLIPKGLVEPVTDQNKKKIATIQSNIKKIGETSVQRSLEILESLKGKSIEFKSVKNDNGHLFAAIRPKDIVIQIEKELKVTVSESNIVIGEPIKSTGEHEINVTFGDKSEALKVIVS